MTGLEPNDDILKRCGQHTYEFIDANTKKQVCAHCQKMNS